MPPPVYFNCLLFNEVQSRKTTVIEVDGLDSRVIRLKNLIFEDKRHSRFRYLESCHLQLYLWEDYQQGSEESDLADKEMNNLALLSKYFPDSPPEEEPHIVVKFPLPLLCLLHGYPEVRPFFIVTNYLVATSTSVKLQIKETVGYRLENCAAVDLELWKVSIPPGSNLNEIHDNFEFKEGMVSDELSDTFTEPPKRGHIHLIVQVPGTSSRSGLSAGSNTGPHEKPAIEKAWKMPFKGSGAASFKSGLDEMNLRRGTNLYANFVPIIQSSGMGKSRLVDETAKLIFTIPFCFRSELNGYPEADKVPRDYFRLKAKETFENVFDRFLLFLEKLFIAVNLEVEKLPTGANPLPLLWYNHLLEDGNRKRQEIYERVVAATESCINDPERPRHYPTSDSGLMKIKETDRPVYAAAKALIDAIKNRANQDVSKGKSRPVRLLVYIDESHEMTKAKRKIEGDGRNAYQVLCSSLNQLRELDLFFVFLSTNSRLSDYSPSSRIFWSHRAQNSGMAFIQTPYTELPFDVWQEPHLISEGAHTMDQVCSVEFMVRFGRPLWWTRWEAGDDEVKERLIEFAIMKLALRNLGKYTPESCLAAISVRLLLDFEPRRVAAMENESLMVAGHLRVANVIPSHREYIISSTPSEPIVAEAAAQVLHRQNMINLLFKNVRDGLIEKGQRGELVARLLLTLAHDAAIEQIDVERRLNQGQIEKLFTTPVPLLAFFATLFAQPHADNIMKCRPDYQSNGPTFEETFKDAYVMFTHFGKEADDWCNSDVFAFMALCRNMAISCREGMKFADLCIPIHFGKETPLSRNVTSAIFVSIKDKEKAMGYNRTYIDVNKMNFFTDGDKARPVILLILQLGIQAPGRYIPVERTKNQKEPGLLTTPERKGRGGLEVPQTPTGVSLLRPGNTVEPPKTRAKDGIYGPTYYTIDARGCSSGIYGVVRPEDKPFLDDLLASKDFLSEHSRQGSEHLKAVMAQKPIWTRGQECCSWANLREPPPPVPQEDLSMDERVYLGRVHDVGDVFE